MSAHEDISFEYPQHMFSLRSAAISAFHETNYEFGILGQKGSNSLVGIFKRKVGKKWEELIFLEKVVKSRTLLACCKYPYSAAQGFSTIIKLKCLRRAKKRKLAKILVISKYCLIWSCSFRESCSIYHKADLRSIFCQDRALY